ncbi:type IV pilus secretin PilQ [Thermodesulfobacteriota bacterium]
MFYEIKKKRGIKALAIFLGLLMIIIAGCVASKTAKKADTDVRDTAEPKIIKEIITGEDPESSMVMIRGNRLLTYTSVKQPYPLGVLLYFPETALENIEKEMTIESDIVEVINASELSDNGQTARIEILLKKDISYEINREDTGIVISFTKPAGETVTAAEQEVTQEELPPEAAEVSEELPSEVSMLAATQLESVEAMQLEKSVKVFVRADGAIKDYKSFTIESPARIVFDMFNIKSPHKKQQVIPVDSEWIKKIRHYGYPDKVRLVVDTNKPYLYAYSAYADPNGLIINVGSGVEASTGEAAEVQYDPSEPAWVNRVDFSSEDAGKSTLIIGTTRAVKYDIKKSDADKLQLKLFNTKLPEHRKWPLITTRFESAVDRITPVHTAAMKDTTLVSIELREAVPYFVEQMDNILLIHFEASSITPKPLEEAKLPSWKQVMAEGAAEAGVKEEVVLTGENMGLGVDEPDPSLRFTGEKIAIDFYKTDIINVFRILRDISGKNFAIDKNVKGQVTLTLEKPVPWDQILDLVLRMNGLGMIQEGNIVRIATRATVKAEQKRARAEQAEEQKLTQEEKELEPLVTEYISVNYASASGDILPHVKPLLSKGRGSVTVDERNNQIIMTDTAEMIEQAKVVVQRIDQVTPQVIIEARIVEASENFARDVGVTWGADTTIQDGEQLGRTGGITDLALAAANPSPGGLANTLGITFERIMGTPLLLDAQLAASESVGDTKIISSPKIVTLNNTAASIKQGQQIPIKTLDADGNTTTTYKDASLELQVTPRVTPDNRISMNLVVKNNSPDTFGGDTVINSKEASTELLVNDGETVVIGGIRTSKETGGEDGVPGLKDIPVLGWLFKSQSKSEQLTELLIFITPRIVQLEQRGNMQDN